MHIYRPMLQIKALTFDLDDTLYNNQPVIERTEHEVKTFLHQRYPELNSMQVDDFRQLRNELLLVEPDIYHDVGYWRWRSINLLLLKHSYDKHAAEKGATEAMAHFDYWRNQVSVPDITHNTLRQLAEYFPLAVITNGNARIELFGLDRYFQFTLNSGRDGRAKPYADMFIKAVQLFDIAPENILHVGDDLVTDISGAINNGLQACWINDQQRQIKQETDPLIFPHIEISRLDSLLTLL